MHPAIALWKEVLANPALRDLPYKVETTRAGAVLMSPASNWHGYAQSQISYSLRRRRRGGVVIAECSILTNEGVKVADVAWASDAFIKDNGFRTPYQVAPEICVEIVSPGNTESEIEAKVNLYLAKGALEAWVIRDDASYAVYDKTGRLKKSRLVSRIDVVKKYDKR